MTEDDDARTLAFYDGNASAYSERRPRREDLESLERFMAEIPAGADVCDLGCGSGWASARLVERGHVVTAIDGSAPLAAEAKRMHGLSVEIATFDEFDFRSAFDGLWACWSLHHTSRTSFPRLLERVSRGIRPGGLLFFAVKGGVDEGRDGNDRLYATYDRSELSGIIAENVDGNVIEHRTWSVDDSCGAGSPRHSVFVRMAT